MKRLFFALWPDQQTRNKIAAFNQGLISPGLRTLKADNLHITLVFLGNTDFKTEMLLRVLAGKVKVHPFVVRFDQLEFWRKPKIICLTPSIYDQQLAILADTLNTLVRQCAMAIEDRPYQPHITLARKAQKLIDITEPLIEWQADSFCLVESVSLAEGIHYQVLQRWKLARTQSF